MDETDPSAKVHFNLGVGEEGELRFQALQRIAEEAGFLIRGRPSVSRWLRSLADDRISRDRSGYYAVLRRGALHDEILFLDRNPLRPGGKALKQSGNPPDVWADSHYLGLMTQAGARALLLSHGIEIGDGEPVLHGEVYRLPPRGAPRAPQPLTRRIVTLRFRELLDAKETRDGHRWPYRQISLATGVNEHVVRSYALGTVRRFDVEALSRLCAFLGCKVGDLLVIEEVPL